MCDQQKNKQMSGKMKEKIVKLLEVYMPQIRDKIFKRE
jgi:hypothetical protein